MWTRGIAGGVLCLVGALWIAQGTDAVHGSGMSGHGQWTVIGIIVLVIGLALLAWAWRIRRDPPHRPA
jgi:uncharacterized membrane protein HdeD (DUF308 family)